MRLIQSGDVQMESVPGAIFSPLEPMSGAVPWIAATAFVIVMSLVVHFLMTFQSVSANRRSPWRALATAVAGCFGFWLCGIGMSLLPHRADISGFLSGLLVGAAGTVAGMTAAMSQLYGTGTVRALGLSIASLVMVPLVSYAVVVFLI